jgi:hypothetical protein
MNDLRAPDAGLPAEIPGEAPDGPSNGWRRVSTEPDCHAEDHEAALESLAVDRRRDLRVPLLLPVTTATIDPVADPVTGERVFSTSDEDSTLNLSRRGLCLRVSRPPAVGTRLLLQVSVPEQSGPIELIGRTCWTRVEFEPGETGARPTCRVGIEVLGGTERALARYEQSLQQLENLP